MFPKLFNGNSKIKCASVKFKFVYPILNKVV